MFNECLEIRWKTTHYQAFDTVLHHQMKHLKVHQKYSVLRVIFNSLLTVSSGDETLSHAWYISIKCYTYFHEHKKQISEYIW